MTLEEPETPPSRQERSEALRQRMVEAALGVFSTHGATGMSLSGVAAAAGVSKQLLLYHFKSKAALEDEILELLISRSRFEIAGLVRDVTAGEETAIAALLARFAETGATDWLAARATLRFLLDGTPAQQARLGEGTRPWLAALVEEFERGSAEGRLRQGLDPEATVAQVGMLLLMNVALMAQGGWTDRDAARWRDDRLASFIRAVRAILLPG